MELPKEIEASVARNERTNPPRKSDENSESPPPHIVDKDLLTKDDYHDAPVLWIKKIYKASRDQIIDALESSFVKFGLPDVKVVELYTSSNTSKDHAYVLLNSNYASKLLLSGTVSISLKVDRYVEENKNDSEHDDSEEDDDNSHEEREENLKETILWFDEADHLEAKDHQDSCILFVQGLPDNRPALQVAQEIRKRVSKWCPISDIDVPADKEGKGLAIGIAKIHFEYGFDAKKCIYLLNYSIFLGKEIKVSFCNRDRVVFKRPVTPISKISIVKNHPNSNNERINRVDNEDRPKPSRKASFKAKEVPPKPRKKKEVSKKNDDGWTTVNKK